MSEYRIARRALFVHYSVRVPLTIALLPAYMIPAGDPLLDHIFWSPIRRWEKWVKRRMRSAAMRDVAEGRCPWCDAVGGLEAGEHRRTICTGCAAAVTRTGRIITPMPAPRPPRPRTPRNPYRDR